METVFSEFKEISAKLGDGVLSTYDLIHKDTI